MQWVVPEQQVTIRWRQLRTRARLLSAFLEELSGAEPPRAEILTTFDPVNPGDHELEWAADQRGRDMFGADWRKVLEKTEHRLRTGSPLSAPPR